MPKQQRGCPPYPQQRDVPFAAHVHRHQIFEDDGEVRQFGLPGRPGPVRLPTAVNHWRQWGSGLPTHSPIHFVVSIGAAQRRELGHQLALLLAQHCKRASQPANSRMRNGAHD